MDGDIIRGTVSGYLKKYSKSTGLFAHDCA